MTDQEIIAVSKRLLQPYVIPASCPYLSEDQRELSKLSPEGRSAWMAEWLLMANGTPEKRRCPDKQAS
jgi:hypothetical protein